MTNFSGKNLNVGTDGPEGGGMDSRRTDQVAEVSAEYLADVVKNAVPVGYRHTEVGVIPEDWNTPKFGEICTLINGRGFKPYEWSSEGLPIIRIQNLNGSEEFNHYKGYYDPKIFVQNGQLLFAWSGSRGTSFGPHIWFGGDALLNYHTWKLVVKDEGVDSGYFFHILKQLTKQIEDSAHGASALVHTQKGEMENFFVPLPSSKQEQTAIANALSDVDALISELEKLITKKQAIKTATMQQLLTGRTRLPQFALREDGTPTNSSGTNLDAGTGGPKGEGQDGLRKGTKPSELGGIPEDWEVVKLGHLAKFFKGSGLPKSELSESGKIKCIHYGQLFTIYGPKIERIISRTKCTGLVTSQENDVLMPTSDVTPNGLATASCIIETGVTLGGDILIIRADKQKLNGVFFSYLVKVLRDQVMQLVTGSTVYHLYGSDMAKFEFAIPPSEEQTAIATILSDMDAEIQALEQRLGKTRQIKQGMMQELLTGKTRLVQLLNKESQHG